VAGTYQVALYRARVSGALIPFAVPTDTTGRQYFRNAGSTKHRGVETGVSVALPWSFSLRASFTHTDALFERYSVPAGPSLPATNVYDGNQIPGVAANRASATLSYQTRRAFAHLETRASSSIAVNDDNTQRSPGYVIHGARFGLGVRIGAMDLTPQLGVMNLFDRDYNTSVVVNAFGGRYFEPGPPRSVYASVGVAY
jgi:iron complex outermembrane receptor protein